MNAADSMQLISIVIAVNALVSGLFLWGVNKDSRDIKANMIETKKHAQYMDRLTHELIEWMISKEVYEKTERGMVHAALKSLGKDREILQFTKVTNPKRLVCKRNLLKWTPPSRQ